MEKKSIAIMQPYFFPYIGYFQLIAATDDFIYRDDVQFVERGWIHRNRLLTEGKAKYITIPCPKGSKYQKISEVEHVMDTEQKLTRSHLLNLVKSYYFKAPFFKNVFFLVQKVLSNESKKVVDLSIHSITETCNYLGLTPPTKRSSKIVEKLSPKEMGSVEGVIRICKIEGAGIYINAPGGRNLYGKEDFEKNNISLRFLEPGVVCYPQFGRSFISHLSIIDVLMFNSPTQIKGMLQQFQLT